MILQIIGKPGSGKSYLINHFKRDHDLQNWYYVDIAEYEYILFSSISRDEQLVNNIINNINNNIICESACGVNTLKDVAKKYNKQHLVIKLHCKHNVMIENHHKRNEEIDNDKLEYYSYLEALMIPHKYIYDTSNHENFSKIFSDIKYKLIR